MAMRNDIDGFGSDHADHQETAGIPLTVPEGTPLDVQLVAQAADAVPAAEGEGTRLVVAIEAGNIARLPAGASIDSPRMNGTDLEFVQPDGSVIVIPEGAVQGL